MTAEERADFERREAIRAARFAAFVERQREADRVAQERARMVLERELRAPRQLDFVI